jgi:tyrosine-protein phosphatase SIW14
MKFFLLALLHLGVTACTMLRQPTEPDGIMQIDEKLWRSAQPDRTEMQHLHHRGIRNIVSLRRFHTDENIISSSLKKSSPPTLHHIPMRAGNIDENDILRALRCIEQCDGPTLVHCWHGADRTGAVIAAYRMVHHNWSAEKAITELHDPRFGHHANVYPNIEKLLRNLDVPALRRNLAASAAPLKKTEITLRSPLPQ